MLAEQIDPQGSRSRIGGVDVLLLTSLGFNGSAIMIDGLAEELAWGGVWCLARLYASGGLVGLNM